MWNHCKHHHCHGGLCPLSACQRGQQVTVRGLTGGQRLRNRLESLGFLPGVPISVVQAHRFGPLVIRLGESQFALGRGMGHHIMVA